MANPTLKKTRLHGFSFTPAPKRGEGGPMVVIDASTLWTDEVRGYFGFEEIPETVMGGVKLSPNSQPISKFVMKPGSGLDGNSIEMEATEMDGFHLFIPTKENESRELRYVIRTMMKNAEVILGKYGRTAGAAFGTLRYIISEAEQIKLGADEQEELPLKGDAFEEHVREINRTKRELASKGN